MQIKKYVQSRLLRATFNRWPAIAQATGLSLSALKKIAYGYVDDPGVQTAQKLIDYFQAVGRGEIVLPPLSERARKQRVTKARPKASTPEGTTASA